MNTRTLWIGAAVLVLAAGCNRNNSQSSIDGDRQATITVSGCLQSAEQGLGSREPNAASRSAEGVDRFVLAPTQSSPSSSPPSASAPGATAPLYLLEGKDDELRTHVGQQIEVTGKPADDDDRSASNPNQPDTRRLEVESVRMLAERCPAI